MRYKKAFTLIELLVIIAIIAMLTGVLMPALGRVREQARIVVVNAELYGIGIALESYGMDNKDKFPPTRADCQSPKHAYALPQELVDSGYLPKGEIGKVRFAKIEDRFNKECTYKYIAVGPKYDYHGTPFGYQRLYIPEDFLDFKKEDWIRSQYDYYESFPKIEKKDSYKIPEKSPVTWAIFSLGPGCDKRMTEQGNFPLKKGLPVLKRFWYSPKDHKGILTRIRLKKGGRHIGSFKGN